MRGRVAYYYGGLARTLELEREPSSLRCCVAAGCGVDERWVMSDHSASTTSLLAVCCRLSAAAGCTLYPRSGLGDSNSMRKPLCPQYTHTHTHTHTHDQTGGRTEVADTWNLVGCVHLGRSLSHRPPSKSVTAASSHKDTTLALAPLYSLFCVLQMPR